MCKKKIKKVSFVSICFILVSLLCGFSFAKGETDNIASDILVKISLFTNGMPLDQVKDNLKQMAQSHNMSVDDVCEQILKKIDSEIAWSNSSDDNDSDKEDLVRSSGGEKTKFLPVARHDGDIFWDSANFFGIQHGHVGIYVHKDWIIEAQYNGRVSHARPVDKNAGFDTKCNEQMNRKKVSTGAKVYEVRHPNKQYEQGKRDKAAKYAIEKLKYRPYYNWPFRHKNDITANEVNCSELVWLAYKKGPSSPKDIAPYTLWGVWPNDILNSPDVALYHTVK